MAAGLNVMFWYLLWAYIFIGAGVGLSWPLWVYLIYV